MPTISYELNILKNNRAAIHVRLSDGIRRIFRRKTGLTINPNNWDFKEGLPKQRDAEEKNKRTRLIDLREKLYDLYDDAILNDQEINKNWLDDCMDKLLGIKKTTDKDRLLAYIDHYIKSVLPYKAQKGKTKGVSNRTIQKYNTLKDKLTKFEEYQKKSYYIKDISPRLSMEFDKYLSEVDKLGDSTTGGYMAALKTMCIYAGNNDEIKTNPKVNSIGVYVGERKIKTILNFKELELIKNCELTDDSLKIARDWLIIGCNTAQRVSDLLPLSKENLKTIDDIEVIDLTNKKTGKELLIPLFAEVKEVLAKYEGNFPPSMSDQHFNRQIKKVAEKAGLNNVEIGELINSETKRKEQNKFPKWMLVSSHIMRRSFATNYYGKYPTPLLMSITKHSTEKQFLNYIHMDAMDHVKQFDDEIKKKNNNNTIN
jgi:integrase